MSSAGVVEAVITDMDCPATQLDICSSSSSEDCPVDDVDDGSLPGVSEHYKDARHRIADTCEILSSSDDSSPRRKQSSGNWLSLLAAASHPMKRNARKRVAGSTVDHEAFMPPKEASASSSIRKAKKSRNGVPSGSESLQPLSHASSTFVDDQKQRLNKGNVLQRSAIPSFAFLSSGSSSTSESATKALPSESIEAKSPAIEQVEAFVTIAGRSGIGGSITKRISVQEVECAMPVSFLPELLPCEFADHLCRTFQSEAKRWHTSKRWLYDKEIESHRLESGFRFDRNGRVGSNRWESAGFSDDIRHLRQVVAGAVQRTRAALRNSSGAKTDTAFASGTAPATKMTGHQVAQEIVALASRGQRLGPQTVEWLMRYAREYKETGWRWEPNYCVANYYADENDFLGAHSDPVESIGPWAVIASLTFGAARQFRMKPVGTVRTRGDTSGRVTSYSIRLPHNSLLIMWEGFQEFWRHEVPKDNGLTPHPISGPARLNFTFRKSVVTVARRRPMCQCGRKAHLKPVLKESSKNRGRYFWSCSNPRVRKGEYKHCDYFQWDDELVVGETTTPRPKSFPKPATIQPHLNTPLEHNSCQLQSVPSMKEPYRDVLPPARVRGGA